MAEARITPRTQDYSQWYQDVIQHAGLAEAAEVVRGCMVIKPHGYAIWEKMQADLDRRFKATGHENAYFPMLIPLSFLAKEAAHVQGFAMEVAVVTHSGLKAVDGQLVVKNELEEPYVVRPTSETIIGHFFAKWIDSYRDLPLLINQWANVMRWELRTRLFLRTGEFLWQEGHTAHASHAEAKEEVSRMLDVYRDFAQEIMALPVIQGVKTANERFAGAVETQCIEAMMQDGKALQAGTSHDLGQNFGKAFNVTFQNTAGVREHVWQTSWGVSTRLVGAVVMAHSDDDGLVLPPKLAPIHVVIVPIYKTDAEKAQTVEAAHRIAKELRDDGLAVKVDDRENVRPGEKYYEWERKGVPLRIELGPRDLAGQQVMMVARHDRKKEAVGFQQLAEVVTGELDRIQRDLFERALQRRRENTHRLETWAEFTTFFEGPGGFAECHWCGDGDCEKQVQEKTKVTIRNLPLDRDTTPGSCVHCGKPSLGRVVFAQSY